MEEKKPVHTISHGYARACIWRNDSATSLLHDVTFHRVYRQGVAPEATAWRRSHSFGGKDLLNLARVILDAHAWIVAQLAGQTEAISPQVVPPKELPHRPISGSR